MPRARTLTDLDYLPLPHAVRTELRRLLARERGWPRYRVEHGLKIMRITRAQWLMAALAFDIDIEEMVLGYIDRTGAQFRRAAHLDGTGIKKSVPSSKNPDFWS